MSQQKLLSEVVAALNECGIPYMVTGSIASSLFGEPRATHDVDLVVELERRHVDELLRRFAEPDYFLQRSSMMEAISHGSMFNLLSIEDGDKVDFWLLTDDPFDSSRFDRRLSKTVMGVDVWISSPEDTILAKLRWAKKSGGSEKQMNDALRVFEVQRGVIDEDYVREWADSLNVANLWQQIQDAADQSSSQ